MEVHSSPSKKINLRVGDFLEQLDILHAIFLVVDLRREMYTNCSGTSKTREKSGKKEQTGWSRTSVKHPNDTSSGLWRWYPPEGTVHVSASRLGTGLGEHSGTARGVESAARICISTICVKCSE